MKHKGQLQIIGALIVGAILVVAGYYINSWLSPPKPINVVQIGTTEFCPSSLYFSYPDYTASFSINYLNSGDHDANFIVTLSSTNILSKYSGDNLSNYTFSTTKGWFLIKGSYQQYAFQLKLNDSSQQPDNITIFTTMKCSYTVGAGSLQTNFGCGSSSTCCYYTKSSSGYNFAGEICG
jgi:hypothetical protein